MGRRGQWPHEAGDQERAGCPQRAAAPAGDTQCYIWKAFHLQNPGQHTDDTLLLMMTID